MATGCTAITGGVGIVVCTLVGGAITVNGTLNLSDALRALITGEERNIKIDIFKSWGTSDAVAGIVSGVSDLLSGIASGSILGKGTVIEKFFATTTGQITAVISGTTGAIAGSVSAFQNVQKCYNSTCNANDYYNITTEVGTAGLGVYGAYYGASGLIENSRINNIQNQLGNLNGKTIVTDGNEYYVPKDWTVKPSDNKIGYNYRNPLNPGYDYIRVSSGDPNSIYPNSQKPYVKIFRNSYLNDQGLQRSYDSPEVHIPIKSIK